MMSVRRLDPKGHAIVCEIIIGKKRNTPKKLRHNPNEMLSKNVNEFLSVIAGTVSMAQTMSIH